MPIGLVLECREHRHFTHGLSRCDARSFDGARYYNVSCTHCYSNMPFLVQITVIDSPHCKIYYRWIAVVILGDTKLLPVAHFTLPFVIGIRRIFCLLASLTTTINNCGYVLVLCNRAGARGASASTSVMCMCTSFLSEDNRAWQMSTCTRLRKTLCSKRSDDICRLQAFPARLAVSGGVRKDLKPVLRVLEAYLKRFVPVSRGQSLIWPVRTLGCVVTFPSPSLHRRASGQEQCSTRALTKPSSTSINHLLEENAHNQRIESDQKSEHFI